MRLKQRFGQFSDQFHISWYGNVIYMFCLFVCFLFVICFCDLNIHFSLLFLVDHEELCWWYQIFDPWTWREIPSADLQRCRSRQCSQRGSHGQLPHTGRGKKRKGKQKQVYCTYDPSNLKVFYWHQWYVQIKPISYCVCVSCLVNSYAFCLKIFAGKMYWLKMYYRMYFIGIKLFMRQYISLTPVHRGWR